MTRSCSLPRSLSSSYPFPPTTTTTTIFTHVYAVECDDTPHPLVHKYPTASRDLRSRGARGWGCPDARGELAAPLAVSTLESGTSAVWRSSDADGGCSRGRGREWALVIAREDTAAVPVARKPKPNPQESLALSDSSSLTHKMKTMCAAWPKKPESNETFA